MIGEEESNKDVSITPPSGQHSLVKAEGRREQKAPVDEVKEIH